MHTRLPLAWLLPATIAGLSAPGLALQGSANPEPVEQLIAPTLTGFEAPSAGVLATTIPGAYPDLWSLQSGSIFRSHEVGLFDSYQPIGSSAVALATLKGLGPSAGTDAVVSVGSLGVRMYTIVAATQLPTLTVVDGGYFTGKSVRCGDVTGDGQADIVVLDQSENLFRVYSKLGSWSLVGTLALSGVAVKEFDLAQMDVVGTRLELVTALSNGTTTYSLAGPSGGSFSATPIMTRTDPLLLDNHVVTLKDHVSKGIDGMAWCARVGTSNSSVLTSASFAVPGFQPIVTLAPGLVVRGLAAGSMDFVSATDANAAHRADLVVNYSNSNLVEFFVNRGPALNQGFIREAPWTGGIEISSPNTTSFGVPVVGDVDGNGFADIITGANANGIQSLWMGLDPVKDNFGGGTPEEFALYISEYSDQNAALHWNVDDSEVAGLITPAMESANISRVASLGLWRQVDGMDRFVAVGTSRCDVTTTLVQDSAAGIIGATISQAVPSGGTALLEPNGDVYALRIQPLTALPDGTRPVYWVALSNKVSVGSAYAIPDWHNNPGLELRPAVNGFLAGTPSDGIGEVIPAIEVRRIKTTTGTTPTPNPSPTVGCVP